VDVSGLVAASCSCQSLSHPTVLWHHRLGHPSLPRLRSMASQCLVSNLPRVFASLPPSPAPLCTPCVEGRLRATPHSSSLRPATAPFQTLHLDVWGPAPRPRPERESFFQVVVDDYSRYTTVFPQAKNSDVTSTLIRWLLATETTRGHRVSCLHSDRGGEFRSGILYGFCSEQGITLSWTLPESPQQNGVAERRIGLVMEIARTSMIHACAPHFLWPYAVRYAAHQPNLWPRVSQPGASPTSLWTGSPGVASEFRVLGCLVLVRDTSADKLLTRAIPCVFLGFPRVRVLLHPVPLSRSPGSPPSPFPCPLSSSCSRSSGTPAPPPGPAPSESLEQPSALPRQVPVDSGGVGAGGASSGGAGVGGTDAGGAGAEGVGAGGTSSKGAGAEATDAGGARSRGTRAGGASTGGASSWGASPGETSSGGAGAGGTKASSVGAEGVGAVGAGEAGAGVVAAGAAPAAAAAAIATPAAAAFAAIVSTCEWPSGPWMHCPARARLSSPFDDLYTIVLCSSSRRSPPQSVLPSPPQSSLTASTSTPITDYCRATRLVVTRVLASLVTDPRASPSSVSALSAIVADFAATRHLDYATHMVAARPLSTGGESALGCDVLDDMYFELEFFVATSPQLCAMLLSPEGDPDALDIPTPRTYYGLLSTYVDAVPPPGANVVDGMWIFKVKRSLGSLPVFKARYVARAQQDYELHSPDFSTAFLQGEEIWLRRPPGFTGTFPPGTQWSLRRPVYGLRQEPREWHDTQCTTLAAFRFRPSSTVPSLFVRSRPTPYFVLVYVDELVCATADRTALAEVKSKLQKRYTCTNLGKLRHYLGLQIIMNRDTRTITLTQSQMLLQHSTTKSTPLAIDHRLTGPFPDEPFKSRGMGLVLGGTQPVVLPGHCDSSYADDMQTQRSTQGFFFSLGARAVSWRSTRSSSVASSSAEADMYAGAMAAQELRWLTFLLTDLGERQSFAPTLFADNKVMILLCREPRLESRLKQINVRYFLLRELQRRGQACLDFVASEANTAYIFTKAFLPGDHHRFYLQLGLVDVGS
ncbi:unnamed protein product, partial [Closterium sp. NIES-53]